MSIKKRILNKIKSINDPEVLHELEEWINNREKESGKAETVNESGEWYQALAVQKKGRKKNDPKSAINWLEKIAEKG
ncbi:MAG: hypothetical protein EA359_19050, partial [Balneolaceae bacterium]